MGDKRTKKFISGHLKIENKMLSNHQTIISILNISKKKRHVREPWCAHKNTDANDEYL